MQPLEPILERFSRSIDLPTYLTQRGFVLDPSSTVGERLRMHVPYTGERLDLEMDPEKRSWKFSDPDKLGRAGTVAHLLIEGGATPAQAVEHLIACADDRRLDDPEAVRYRNAVRQKPPQLARAVNRHLEVLDRTAAATRSLKHLGVHRDSLDQWRFGKLASEAEVSIALADPPVAWFSRYRTTDKTLVITERPLDAFAYEQARGSSQSCCYMAIGSQTSHERRELLEKVLKDLPTGMAVVVACGDHTRGRQLLQEVRQVAPERVLPSQPPPMGNRWADYAALSERHRKSMSRSADLQR